MPKIKIGLGKNETMFEAEEFLFKALDSHRSGDVHTEKFEDPAMEDVVNRMDEKHKMMYEKLIREIMDELDKEYGQEYDF